MTTYVKKRNKILIHAMIHATTLITLENMLSDRNQTQKANIVRFPLYKMFSISKYIENLGGWRVGGSKE